MTILLLSLDTDIEIALLTAEIVQMLGRKNCTGEWINCQRVDYISAQRTMTNPEPHSVYEM
jgi:hypothetical protein